ncbi:V-set and transmembrane domain-containing protein 2-like protein isoform X2 [Macaca fascicularis]|uniref:V-set and transmembrane domain containing 2 like n=1 Tax=Macaca nemestrina TaxID=9545 RepID=A0A2K6DV79_MACNE
MGAPLAVALGALHYLALFLQLGGATRPAGHAPWDNHVSGHGGQGGGQQHLPQAAPVSGEAHGRRHLRVPRHRLQRRQGPAPQGQGLPAGAARGELRPAPARSPSRRARPAAPQARQGAEEALSGPGGLQPLD